MADSSNFKRDDRFEENDPFAELTRIMGHDPRAGQRQPDQLQEMAEDPFEIDLERELMGEFDGGFDHDASAPAEPYAPASFDEPMRTTGDAVDSAGAESPEAVAAGVQDEIDREMETLFEEDLDLELTQSETAGEQFQQPAAPADTFDDENAWAGESVEAAAEEPVGEALPYEAEPEAEPEPYEAVAYETAVPSNDDQMSEVYEDGLAAADPDLALDLDLIDDFARGEDEAAHGETASADPYLADVDMDFAELPAGQDPEAMPAADEEHAMAADDWQLRGTADAVTAEAAPDAELSLEDELSMLLAAGDAPAAADDATPVEPVHPRYGRANLTGAAAVGGTGLARAPSWAGEPVHAAPSSESAEDVPSGDDHLSERGIEDELTLDHDQFEPERAEYQAPEAVEPAPDPFAELARLAPFPAYEAPKPAAAAPDLDMLDVPEKATALSDDLELPEVPVDEAPVAVGQFDDLDAEFAEMFGAPDHRSQEVAPEAETPDEDHLSDHYFQQAMGGAAAGLAYAGAAAAGATASPYRPNAGRIADASDAGYDPDLDRETALPDGQAAARPPRWRRPGNTVLAAAIGGVALLALIGIFAFGGGGATNDAPALVLADAEPLKVRPENPGGTQVPNQDSQAYERAAGGVGDTVPAQEALVTTAEEPVNVAERVAPDQAEPVAPGVELGEAADDATAKAEDRILPQDSAEGVGTDPDLIAVTPRRVRTMIVRPDGTLVPREEVEEPAAAEQQAPVVADAPQAAPMLPAPTLAPASPQSETNAAPAAPAPQAAAPVPSPAPQQAQSAPASRPEQVAAAPAAARPQPAAPAPAAATGEWSMQIASQPTAEGAQASYEDLARRYSDLLSGRGVNIVRAEIAGKGTYYRVRIPSTTRNDAIALCERYKAAGGSCFVSK